MSKNNIHKKVVKIISQNLIIDIQQPFKLSKSSSGICTGFFIANNLILTCAHCVLDSNDIYMEVPYLGKKKYKLELLGVCPHFDIALLKSNEYKSKYFFKLGDSNKIKAGNEVYAVGFPLGQSNLKITKGIISGLQFDSIQIDAALNPGNSGGPLIHKNIIIGINKSGYNKSNNVGYSSPIENYKIIKKDLLNKENILIRRPENGFTTNNTNKSMLEFKKCKKSGINICNIFENSPISSTNIKQNDILCKINNIDIDNYGLIKSKVTNNDKVPYTGIFDTIKLNNNIKIEYYSNGKNIKETFKYKPYTMPIKYIYPRFEKIEYEILGGVMFMDFYINHLSLIKKKILSSELYRYLNNIDRIKPKVIISYLYPNTDISNLSILEVGDFINEVNNIKINTIEDFRKAILKPKTVNNIKYIIIKTDENEEIVLNLNDIIKNEEDLSKTFKYPITNIYNKLKKLK